MRGRLASLLGVGLLAVGMAFVLLRGRGASVNPPPADEPLEPLVESPRPLVQAEAPRPTLQGRPPPRRTVVSESDRAALVQERNDLAREHRREVDRYKAGSVSILAVEEAEMRLLDARHRLGEIDRPTWHRARAVLVARDVERTQAMVEAGRVSPLGLDRVRLSLELEKMLAGDANTYEASRVALFTALKEQRTAMVDAGRETSKALQEDLERLEAEVPPADVAKAQDR